MSSPFVSKRRSIGAACLLILASFGGACGNSGGGSAAEGEGAAVTLSLPALFASGVVAARPDADLPLGGELEYTASGLASVALHLKLSAGTRVEWPDGFHFKWALPYPASQLTGADQIWPTIEIPGVEPKPVNINPENAMRRREPFAFKNGLAVWIDGKELHILSAQGPQSAGQILLRYPVQAARLAGAVGVEQSAADLFWARQGMDSGTHQTLVFETGTEVSLPLEDFPGARLSGRLVATAESTRLGIASGDEPLAWIDASESLQKIEFELPAGPGDLRLVTEGPAGALLQIKEPRLDFTQTVEAHGEQLNVLFVILDTLRADRMATFGGPSNLTPNLDRLAGESLVFEQCWSTSCWTLPAIASMMTGVHAEVHGGTRMDTTINPELDTLGTVLRDAGYYTEAISEGGLFRGLYGLDRGYTRFTEHQKGVATGVTFAKEFFKNRAGDNPWFLTLHSYEVHEPYLPDPELLAAVKASLPANLAERITRPTDFIELHESGGWVPTPDNAVAAAMEKLYNAEVQFADQVLGELIDQLRAGGVLDNTLVVFTADHGEEFGEHGLLGHGDTLYPEQVHIPLMLRFPDGWRAGEKESAPVSQLNLAPTILDAVGLLAHAEGKSFAGTSLLRGIPDVPIYAWRHNAGGEHMYTVRVGDEVYIEGDYEIARDVQGPELYDLAADPGAKNNLAGEQAERAASMQALLESVRTLYSENAFEGGGVQLDAATRAELEALGYL